MENYKSPVKGFFKAELDPKILLSFPSNESEEQETIKLLVESTEEFLASQEKQLKEFDVKGSFSDEYLSQLKELGLFGLIIPEEFGGVALSNHGYSRLVQQITRHDGATSVTVAAHSSIGLKGLLLYGTQAQKQQYLRKLCTGELIAAFCLTEAGSGSDAASIKTSAKKNDEGNWVLNGEKIWISNAPFADFFTVFARTDSPQGEISAFIVERGYQGLSTGHKEDKMGIRGSATSTVSFDNVVVPKENLLGTEGEGFKIAMNILNNGRTGIGGGSVGAMKYSIELASKQAKNRKQFGQSLSEFELIKDKVSQMTAYCFATESVVRVVANYIDNGTKDFSIEAAICKVYSSDALWVVANEALQIAGGNGYMREYPYEKIVRDARINIIFEGTNEILRLYIALTCLKELGEDLKNISADLKKSISNKDSFLKSVSFLSRFLPFNMDIFQSNEAKEMLESNLVKYWNDLQFFSNKLYTASASVLKKYRKDIINQQLILKNLADISIELFVMSCSLSRVNHLAKVEPQNTVSTAILEVIFQNSKDKILQALKKLDRDSQNVKEISNYIFENEKYTWDTI